MLERIVVSLMTNTRDWLKSQVQVRMIAELSLYVNATCALARSAIESPAGTSECATSRSNPPVTFVTKQLPLSHSCLLDSKSITSCCLKVILADVPSLVHGTTFPFS